MPFCTHSTEASTLVGMAACRIGHRPLRQVGQALGKHAAKRREAGQGRKTMRPRQKTNHQGGGHGKEQGRARESQQGAAPVALMGAERPSNQGAAEVQGDHTAELIQQRPLGKLVWHQ